MDGHQREKHVMTGGREAEIFNLQEKNVKEPSCKGHHKRRLTLNAHAHAFKGITKCGGIKEEA